MAIGSRAADLAYMFKDAGVSVTLGAASTYGTVRRVGLEVVGDPEGRELASRRISVRIATGSLAGLDVGVSITVAGTAYIVRERMEQADGAETVLECVKEK